MNRSKSFENRCFVPSCTNSGSRTRDKLFFCVKPNLQEKWCQQVDIPYNPNRRMFCCEDHLNLDEDVRYYSFWKSRKITPSLKPTAVLRIPPETIETLKKENETEEESPSLLKELLQSCEPPPKRQHVMSEPLSTVASMYTTKVHASTQCDIYMEEVNKIKKKSKRKEVILSASKKPPTSKKPPPSQRSPIIKSKKESVFVVVVKR